MIVCFSSCAINDLGYKFGDFVLGIVLGPFLPREFVDENISYTAASVDSTIAVTYVSDNGSDKVYIPDTAFGKQVNSLGNIAMFFGADDTHPGFSLSSAERVYLPWSIEKKCSPYLVSGPIDRTNELVFLWASNSTSVATFDELHIGHPIIYVVTSLGYEKIISEEWDVQNDYIEEKVNFVLPANIAYFFNYEENPNEGYFFVDLLEETGKLTPPPYNPHREGYTFEGWYKDAECTEAWDFAKDEVKITFDEDGNRIYEEVKLYAKWRWK